MKKILGWLWRRRPARGERTRPAGSKLDREQRLMQQRVALASVTSEHPLWVTVLEIIDEHERSMMTRAIEEGLAAEARAYNAGLAASAEYLANALRDLKEMAEKEVRRKKEASD